MLDLDGFKAFNDACGHPAGDAFLVAVAGALGGATRAGDRLYRYGGDEFVVILADADRATAHEVAVRIRRGVAELSGTTGGPHVTVSVGVACHPDDGSYQGRAGRDGRPGAVPRQAGGPLLARPGRATTIRTCGRSTRPRSRSSTGTIRACCSRRS